MGEKSTQLYDMAESFAARLKKYVVAETDDKEEEDVDIDADYIVDEKARTCSLTGPRHQEGGGVLPSGQPRPTRRTAPLPTTSTRPSRPTAS